MSKKSLFIGICAVVLICLGIVIYRAVSASSQDHTGSTITTTAKFVTTSISADGAVTVQSQAVLNFQTPGKLIYLPFKVGDKVFQGQAVAQLDQSKLQANLRQAEQSFTAAKAASEKLYNDQGYPTAESYDQKVKRTAVDATQNIAYDSVVKARQDITDATLVSSVNGILTRQDVSVTGVNVTPTTTFIVSDPDTLVFRANVSLSDIYYISVGSQVTLALDGIPNKLTGTVVTIYPSKVTLPTGQAVYQVDIASDDLKKQAKLDEAGTALISTNSQNVALVPAWLVLSGKYIWTDDNGTPVLRDVKVGKIHGNEIEIIKGLAPSDKIIVNPKFIPSKSYQLL
jgi:RND family efflux transporter MFP subunit